MIQPPEKIMSAFGDSGLIRLDGILRAAHATYISTGIKSTMEYDKRAQASATYCHIVAEANRIYDGMSGVRLINVGGLNLWLFEDISVVVSFKKMSSNGAVKNHASKQQRAFDSQMPLPGVPPTPTRLRVGYLLDPFNNYVRTQIATPRGKSSQWCVAIHAPEARDVAQSVWYNIADQQELQIA